MWQIKTFKTKQAMTEWLAKYGHRIQWDELIVCNGYAIEYRKLRVIRFK